MFPSKFCLATVLLSLQLANSYILLTANLDDVHSLAKQIADSPVVNQINEIIRKAATTFNDQNQHGVRKHNSEHVQKRSNSELNEDLRNPEVQKHSQDIQKQSDPELDENPEKPEVQKHNRYLQYQSSPESDENPQKPEVQEHNRDIQKQSSDEMDEKPQKPEVQKHKSEYIQKQSNPGLVEDPQIKNRQNLKANTEKHLLRSSEEYIQVTGAASADDLDDIEVWSPDKKALMSELNSKSSGSSSENSAENDVKPSKSRRKQDSADFAELGRNASFYLTSIKKIFESV